MGTIDLWMHNNLLTKLSDLLVSHYRCVRRWWNIIPLQLGGRGSIAGRTVRPHGRSRHQNTEQSIADHQFWFGDHLCRLIAFDYNRFRLRLLSVIHFLSLSASGMARFSCDSLIIENCIFLLFSDLEIQADLKVLNISDNYAHAHSTQHLYASGNV